MNYADGTNLYQATARFEPGTHDWQYASVIVPVPKAVARFSIHLLFHGNHTGTVWFDDVTATYPGGNAEVRGEFRCLSGSASRDRDASPLAWLAGEDGYPGGIGHEAEAKGLDVSLLRVSLSVANVFTPLLAEDASLEVADYPKDMIDFRILGREETLRRIQSLASFEADQTEKVLDQAIEEARAILKNPASSKKSQSQQQPKPVTVENGAFTCDGKPIFLSGIFGLAVRGDPKRLDLAKDLGANLLGPLHISHACTWGWDQFDDSYFEKHVLAFYGEAQSKGFWVNPALWNYRAPGLAGQARTGHQRQKRGHGLVPRRTRP